MSGVTFFFWFSGVFILYSYFGYPLVLKIISLFKPARRSMNAPSLERKVTLLISAYNEEAVIEEKILNSLALHYPRSLLEIVVVSDGSTDTTCDIVSRYADRGVKLWHYEGRIGKTACLNQAVRRAEGEVIVFSDANSQYNKEAIRELVKHFADERVGFVTGRTIYVSGDAEKAPGSIGLYSKIEQWTKTLESEIGSCVGADGAIFAIRKALYRPLNGFDINDFVIPLNVVKQGYWGKLENNAFCLEKTAGAPRDEFYRQVRIANRTIRALVNHADLLNPLRFGFLSFEIFSHKVVRLFVPFFMLLLFLTSLGLAVHASFYLLFFTGQLFFYFAAGLNHSFDGPKGASRLFSIPHTFSLVNLAIAYGWIQYFKGETYVVWAPSQR
jgi:cellulose synthase/poly-beta-1,6-N-acetylglucosamine synthase-like glycosyltransferase